MICLELDTRYAVLHPTLIKYLFSYPQTISIRLPSALELRKRMKLTAEVNGRRSLSDVIAKEQSEN